MDIIFILACLFLPFENFFFAPSEGWAAISPLIFIIYLMLNYKYAGNSIRKYYKLLLLVFWGIVTTLINSFFYEIPFQNIIRTLISLGLGISTLFAFDIYFIQKNRSTKKLIRYICIGYYISLFIGFAQYFVIRFNIVEIKKIFMFLEKRSYIINDRVQFTFTEPSFIGMHLYGILLPLYVFGKSKKIRNLMIIFAMASITLNSGVRIIIDTIAVLLILTLNTIDFRKLKNSILVILFLFSIPLLIGYIYNSDYRIKAIVNYGIYADGSLATRYFRIQSSLIGYKNSFNHALMGYGLGNSIKPLKLGYGEAIPTYQSDYLSEVLAFSEESNYSYHSVSYCMYIRLMSEFGILSFFIIFCYMSYYYKTRCEHRWKMLFWVVIYLYVQFESYGFYSIWLFIVLLDKYNCKKADLRRWMWADTSEKALLHVGIDE